MVHFINQPRYIALQYCLAHNKEMANHDTLESLFAELAAHFIGNFSEDCATEDAELYAFGST
jgi:hypothetical protein